MANAQTVEGVQGATPAIRTKARPTPVSHHERTYFALRRIIWLMGLLLIVILPAIGCSVDDHVCLKSSYSAYYHVHDAARNIFVGMLFAIGASLIAYRGFDQRENWLLDVAGLAAFFIAFFPTRARGAPTDAASVIHNGAAICLFVSIAWVALRPQTETMKIEDPRVRACLRWWYRLAARLMILGSLGATGLAFALGQQSYTVWAVELMTMLAFSIDWSVKNVEMKWSLADMHPRSEGGEGPLPLATEIKIVVREFIPVGKKMGCEDAIEGGVLNRLACLRQIRRQAKGRYAQFCGESTNDARPTAAK